MYYFSKYRIPPFYAFTDKGVTMNERKTAQQTGAMRYSTGKPCKRGHLSDRYTSNGMCIACFSNYGEETKYNRRLINAENFDKNSICRVFADSSGADLLRKIGKITMLCTAAELATMMQVADFLMAEIKKRRPNLMKGELTRDALLARVRYDPTDRDDPVLDLDGKPFYTNSAGYEHNNVPDLFYVIDGHTYMGSHMGQLFAGKTPSIFPVPFDPFAFRFDPAPAGSTHVPG
jgi:hypothetical protein